MCPIVKVAFQLQNCFTHLSAPFLLRFGTLEHHLEGEATFVNLVDETFVFFNLALRRLPSFVTLIPLVDRFDQGLNNHQLSRGPGGQFFE